MSTHTSFNPSQIEFQNFNSTQTSQTKSQIGIAMLIQVKDRSFSNVELSKSYLLDQSKQYHALNTLENPVNGLLGVYPHYEEINQKSSLVSEKRKKRRCDFSLQLQKMQRRGLVIVGSTNIQLLPYFCHIKVCSSSIIFGQ